MPSGYLLAYPCKRKPVRSVENVVLDLDRHRLDDLFANVKNKITGKEGVVTAKFYLISGCVTV